MLENNPVWTNFLSNYTICQSSKQIRFRIYGIISVRAVIVRLERKKLRFARNEIVLENWKVDEYKRVEETVRRRKEVERGKRERRWRRRRRTKREVSSYSLTRPLRYDNISQAPGKHCRRSPEGMLPKLAAASFVGDSSSERKRWPAGRGGQRRCSFTLSSRSPFLLLSPAPLSLSLFLFLFLSLARTLSRRKTRNTKQNRMLLGFCRAPPKPPCAVPCRPMILQASNAPRSYY